MSPTPADGILMVQLPSKVNASEAASASNSYIAISTTSSGHIAIMTSGFDSSIALPISVRQYVTIFRKCSFSASRTGQTDRRIWTAQCLMPTPILWWGHKS